MVTNLTEARNQCERTYRDSRSPSQRHQTMYGKGWLPGTVSPYAGRDILENRGKMSGLVKTIVEALETAGEWSPHGAETEATVDALNAVLLNTRPSPEIDLLKQGHATELLLVKPAVMQGGVELPQCVQWYVRRSPNP